MVPGTDGQLQGAADGRGRRPAAHQRHGQSAQGRVAGPGDREPGPGHDVTEVAPGLSSFAGLRVVEMGVWVAAPSAAMLLADWGADVIKVEPPAGDPMRAVFGSLGIESDMPNPAFALDNRGKRSVVLNLRQEEQRQQLEELIATADVFI